MKKHEAIEVASFLAFLAFFAGFLSAGAADWFGLWGVIIPVLIFTVIEGLFSFAGALDAKRSALWVGLMFHLIAAGAFFVFIYYLDGHQILQTFEYDIELGHGNFEFASNDAGVWWWLINTLSFRAVIVETALLITYLVQSRKNC